MQRRTFIAAAGSSLAAALAGCTASADDENGDSDDSTPDPTPEPTDAVTVETGERLSAVVGEAPTNTDGMLKPYHVRLTNPKSKPWTAKIDVSPALGNRHVETYELQTDATVSVALRLPAEYEVTVTDVHAETTTTETFTPDDFDCNESWTAFSPGDGEISVSGGSTRMACQPPVIPADDSVSVSVGDGSLPDDMTKPHSVSISNPPAESEKTEASNESEESNDPKKLETVTLSLETDEEAVAFGGTYQLEPGARLDVALTEARKYVAKVERGADGDGEQATKSVDIKESNFDCNASTTAISLQADGGIKAATMSTLMYCGDIEGNESNESNESN
ncbi:hypothetical protein E6P09_11565 [Haloferax mediterranei ATCC 33500]|uniref:Uncharacterized protein n=1 Tax=Haloferax mediterranei (strain ATCC 33500 / DSM 1411 / JCM 8866 / NBRC 14739 / NCIMB 2177 / R-4) TaxID=523841 RepID=I3R5A5_HALMT|nr:hypothetical protein [Haloferax mediterranei]AFK19415.1 hypothetical protein HFX_1709 [Haloferax mediterranei ATCC 33500]AHZ21235.1 hypothetical protein BM92_00565 [Haloferax mediterranei ATCC 33500]EMA04396.1 hypothetical protein C439_01937 [Haloferax mediterranei ATCC 33500]MDX5989518.1 hypothetical protein [Haloferax mediterranei ATCC 33500]QCQ75877.1 hypothetical protein E6P09_11565 [Haloferax mediterranei ATCC 33500]